MIRLKKLTALLVSAALALSLLAGCGGSKALSQVIAGLLSGQYNNVTVEVDPDLTAALKKAAAAGSTQEEVLAALVENLNLSGVNMSFNNLEDGQQGQHGVTLTFQPGSDPDAAARSAFTEWNSVFSSLPDDGSYRAHVSMIEAEGGYYIAVDVEVLKAGSPHKDDGDDDKDNGDNGDDEDDAGYTTTEEDGTTTYTVTTGQGLQNLVEDLKWPSEDTILSVNITLNCDVTLDALWIPIGADSDNKKAYTGTFDGQGHTISGLTTTNDDNRGSYFGLFSQIDTRGTVQNLTLESSTVIGKYAGAVAGKNNGLVKNCHVVDCTINGEAYAGGVVGTNESDSSVIGCSSSAKVTGTGSDPYTGGVVGQNNGGSVTACSSTGDVTANGSDTYTYAGGVVGTNSGGGTVTACYATGNVTANGSDGRAGGVVGYNSGSVTACYHANGAVEGTGAGGVVGTNSGGSTVTACYSTGTVNGNTYAGGVVGYNNGTVTACYWSGSVDGDKGVGSGNQAYSSEYKENGSNKVSDDTTWEAAVDSMNNNITTGWWYVPNGNSAPTQFTQRKPSTSTTP